jgi:hypothetical protein
VNDGQATDGTDPLNLILMWREWWSRSYDGTDPLNSDTDGDGVDGQKATDGTDPLNSDTDGDG